MSEHELEMAKALVKVKDGNVQVLTKPLIHRCPLRRDLYGCQEEDRETVEKVRRMHIRELGMYSPNRVLETVQKSVSFGASDIIADAMTEGLVDAAVVVCEGAGTVIITKPEVLQAVGAHMTGLISTEPIKEIQGRLKHRGCILLDYRSTIDQVKGYARAVEAGFKKIVVTITGHKALEVDRLWEMGKISNVKLAIFSVHNTGISNEEAQTLAKYCDIVWACASEACEHGIHPGLPSRWKDDLAENPEKAFSGNGKMHNYEARIAELERLLGQSHDENELLKKPLP